MSGHVTRIQVVPTRLSSSDVGADPQETNSKESVQPPFSYFSQETEEYEQPPFSYLLAAFHLFQVIMTFLQLRRDMEGISFCAPNSKAAPQRQSPLTPRFDTQLLHRNNHDPENSKPANAEAKQF